jgi:hypothetical protein
MNGEKTNTYRKLVGKTEGKRPLRRPGPSLVNIVKMDIRDIGRDGIG